MNQLIIPVNNDISVKLVGGIDMTICTRSDVVQPYWSSDSTNANHRVEIDGNTIVIINDDKIDEQELVHTQQAVKNKQSALAVIGSLISDVWNLAHQDKSKNHNVFSITLYVQENSNLKIEGDSVYINLNMCKLSQVLIKCANTKISGNEYGVNKLDIDSANISADLLFNEQNKYIQVVSSNAKISIHKSNLAGEIQLEGNHIKTKGSFLHKGNDGIFIGKFNNAKVNISET